MNNRIEPKEQRVSCRMSNAVLAYLESLGYDTDAVVKGLPYTKEYLKDPYNWITGDVIRSIWRRAAVITGDDAVMYQVGLSALKNFSMGSLVSFIRILAGPRTVYRSISQYTYFFNRNVRFKVTFKGSRRAIVVMRMKGGYQQAKDSCYYSQGMLAAVPTLWGLPPAEVREMTCMCHPDNGREPEGGNCKADACVYELTWQSLPSWWRRTRDNLFFRKKIASNYSELELNLRQFDNKNAELIQRNQGLTQVREIALGVDKVRTIDEALTLAVEGARNIGGVSFVIIQKLDESGKYVTTPCYSKIRQQNVVGSLIVHGIDPYKLFGETTTSKKHRFLFAKLKEPARDYFTIPEVFALPRLAHLMDGVWPQSMCDAIQRILNIKQIITVPLIVDEKSWGVMVFLLDKDVPVDILEMIGAHCATAIKNVGTLEELERRNRELSALNSIAGSTSRSLEINKLLSSGIREIARIFGAQSVAAHLWDENTRTLKLSAQTGMPEAMAKQSSFIRKNASFFGEFFSSTEEIKAGNPDEFLPGYPDEKAAAEEPPLSYAIVILRMGSRRYGIVTLARPVRAFEKEEQSLLLAISAQLGVAIENSRLHEAVLGRMNEAESARRDLQKAMQSLEKSEEELRCTFESVSAGVLVTDLTGRVVKMNDAVVRMHGYANPEEIIGINYLELFTEEDRGRAFEKLGNLLEVETIEPVEAMLLKKNGGKFPGEVNASVIKNTGGKPVGFVCTIRDISRRRRNEAAIKTSEEKFKLITEKSVVGIYIIQNANLVYINPSAARMLGYEPEEIIGVLTPADIIHHDDLGMVINKIGEKLEGSSEEAGIKYRGIKKDGSLIDVEIYGMMIDYQGQPAMMGTVIDISERKRTEEALKSKLQFKETISSISSRFVGVGDDVDDAINKSLSEIGRLCGASRAYLFLFNEDGIAMDNTHEWCAEGVTPQIDNLKNLPVAIFPWWMTKLQRGEVIHVQDVSQMPPEAEEEKKILESQDIKSILVLPVNIGGKLTGFIGFDNVAGANQWDDSSIAILRVSSEIIGITLERRQAEKGLRESEEKFAIAFTASPEAIAITALKDGKFLEVNDSFTKLTGYTPEEVLGRSTVELGLWGKEARDETIKEMIKKGIVHNKELTTDVKSGERRDCLYSAEPINIRGEPCILSTITDITERKRAEGELRAQKDLIDRILATMPSAVAVLDRDARIIMANQAFYRGFNLEEPAVNGRRFVEVVASSELNQAVIGLRSGRDQYAGLEFSYVIGKQERTMSAGIFAMSQGEVLVVINDLTSERERLERLNFKDRLASVGEMASGVAHELNNSMTGIIGLSRLLMKLDMPAEVKEDLASINHEAQRAATISRSLLTFTRKRSPARDQADIKNIVNDVLKMRSYEHRLRNIAVETSFPGKLPPVTVDYFQMQQVFLNIVLNAEAAMLGARGRGTLRIAGEKYNGGIRVAFSDDGPGIPRENLNRLFSPFFTTKEEGEGTGLGLSICHGIVTAHGGKIYAESTPGAGATFFIELPTKQSLTA